MKITVSIKDPDLYYNVCRELGLDSNDLDDSEFVYATLGKYTTYSEYIDIEFDFDKRTARIVENEDSST